MTERVLVTGISGFIAKHVALQLLEAGYEVRGTIRTPSRADEVRSALQAAGVSTVGLSFAQADLGADAGWDAAASGCAYVQHIASPFPLAQPRDREALVPEARAGTIRVLEAARSAEVRRVVLTSSIVSMMYRANRPPRMTIRENDWTDAEWGGLSAYIVAKTRAERAAWLWAREFHWQEKLSVVNPGFVLGPLLDDRAATSVEAIKLMLEGAVPAIPNVAFPVVDVRDVAAVHVKAMTTLEAGGRRLIAAGDTMSMPEMGSVLRHSMPVAAAKVPKWKLPSFALRLLSGFDRTLRSLTPDLGVVPVADSGYVTDMTGVVFRPAAEAVRESGRTIVSHGLI